MKHHIVSLALLCLASGVANGQAALGDAREMTSPPSREAVQSRFNYMQHCMGCHLPDGCGAPDKGIPSMRDMLGQFLAVPGGRAFIVQVPGVMNSALGIMTSLYS